jgi:hypothetical protein
MSLWSFAINTTTAGRKHGLQMEAGEYGKALVSQPAVLLQAREQWLDNEICLLKQNRKLKNEKTNRKYEIQK